MSGKEDTGKGEKREINGKGDAGTSGAIRFETQSSILPKKRLNK
jgi:hypothetical protein